MEEHYNVMKKQLGLDQALADSSEDEQDEYIKEKSRQKQMVRHNSSQRPPPKRVSRDLIPMMEASAKHKLLASEF